MENIIKPEIEEKKEDPQYGNNFVSDSEDHGVLALKSYFGNDITNDESEAIDYIYKTLGGTIENIPQLLHFIKETEMKIGIPSIGQSKIMALKQYIKLNQELKFIKKEIEQYER